MIYDNGQLDVTSLFSSETIDKEYDYSDDDIDENDDEFID